MSAMTVDVPAPRPRLRAVPVPAPDRRRPPAAVPDRLLHVVSAAVAMACPRGPVVALPPFRTAAAARAWLDAALPTLLDEPDPAFARRLAPALAGHLEATGRHPEAAELHARALMDGGGPAERLRLAGALTRIGWHEEAAAVAGPDRRR